MLEVGRIYSLKVHNIDESGAWMQAGRNQILLPKKEMPREVAVGKTFEVFVFFGATGELLATCRRPKAQVGEFVMLKVNQVTKYGAFLDWGLEKDLLVPFSEQPDRMQEGRSYLVRVCHGDEGRLIGTARLDRCLETEEIDLTPGQEVDLMVWRFTDLGAMVIINDLFGGLLFKDEIRTPLKRGQRFKGYIKEVREDKKIDVTLRKAGQAGTDEDKETLLRALEQEGFLPLHDKSSPADIQQRLGMSKKAFKKAIGGLYREKKLELTEGGIRLKEA